MKPARSRETFARWPFGFAMAVRPVIFLPKNSICWDQVAKEAVLGHERVHHRQQRALGLCRFAFAYYFSRRLRWRIERAGYRREFAICLKHGQLPNEVVYAQTLSGRFYARMIGYKEALAWCEQTLRRLERDAR